MSDSAVRVAAAAAAAAVSASAPVTASSLFHQSHPILHHQHLQSSHVENIVQTEPSLFQSNSAVGLFASEAPFAPPALSPASPNGRPSTPPLSSATTPPFSPYSTGTNGNDQEERVGQEEGGQDGFGFGGMEHPNPEDVSMGPLDVTGLCLPVNDSQESILPIDEGGQVFPGENGTSDLHRSEAPSSPPCSGNNGAKNKLATSVLARKKRPVKKSPVQATFDSYRTGQKYPCTYPDCPKLFERRYNLSVHLRSHTGETPYTCEVAGCGKKFKWRSSMAHHIKTHQRKGDINYKVPIVQDKNKSSHFRRQAASKLAARQAAARMLAVQQHQHQQQQQQLLEKPHQQQKHNKPQNQHHSEALSPEDIRRAMVKGEDLVARSVGAAKPVNGSKTNKKNGFVSRQKDSTISVKSELPGNVESSSPFRAAMKAATSAAAAAAADNLNAGMGGNVSPAPTPQASKPVPALTPGSAAIAASTVFSQSPSVVIGDSNCSATESLPAPFSLGSTANAGYSALSTGGNVGNVGCKEAADNLFHTFVRQEAEGATVVGAGAATVGAVSVAPHANNAFSYANPDPESSPALMDDMEFDWRF